MEARIDNYRCWIKGCEAEELKKSLESVVVDAGFTILNFMEHHYQPFGYTRPLVACRKPLCPAYFPRRRQDLHRVVKLQQTDVRRLH